MKHDKVIIIEQEENSSIQVNDFDEMSIEIQQVDIYDAIYIDIASLPDLIAALQSFLKETE